jgi:hypothetical protein
MRKYILIPALLFLAFQISAAHAEDLFDLKFGTSMSKIQKRYPDLKPEIDGFYTHSARTRDSVFNRLTFQFDEDKKLIAFSGVYFGASEVETRQECHEIEAILSRQFGTSDNDRYRENGIMYDFGCSAIIRMIRVMVSYEK